MSGSSSARNRVATIIAALREAYGPIPWWQAPPEEVMIGAVLVQQTRWEHAERALESLRKADLLSLAAIDAAPAEAIEGAVRCAGFFRVKARRLRALASFVLVEHGSVEAMARVPTGELRRQLLGVPGIGEETADAILCYALDRPAFVLDAYARRICACAGVAEPRGGYRPLFEAVLPPGNRARRETHAHIVEYGKAYCSRRRCGECTIQSSKR